MSVSKKKDSQNSFHNSVLIYYLTKFAGVIYRLFLAGFFGWILTAYEALAAGFSSSVIAKKLRAFSGHKIFHSARNAKRFIALAYERSFFLHVLRSTTAKLLTSRLASFGIFFFSYGFYLILIQLIKEFGIPGESMSMSGLIIGGAYMLGGAFCLFSKKNVAYVVYHSKIFSAVLFDFLGIRTVDVIEASKTEIKTTSM